MNAAFRIAILNSHPIQYFAPLYAFLNKEDDVEVAALYCSDFSIRGEIDPGFNRVVKWDVDLLSGYNVVFLGPRARQRTPAGFWSLICPEVWREIRSKKYDAVVIHGYAYAAYVLGFLAALSARVPIFYRADTHLAQSRPRWKLALRDLFLSCASRLVTAFLAIGTANRAYYRSLGVPDERIFDVPFAVDNERFMAAASLTAERRAEIRMRYGVTTDAVVAIYASKLTRQKHPDDLIRAVEILDDSGVKVTALIVGDGEMREDLEMLSNALTSNNVKLLGFINQAELPELLAASDIFVLPAENEAWGLIVNEAMCAGLPVIVGRTMGCAPDLVKEGRNGYLVPAGDASTLAHALKELAQDALRRRKFGEESMRLINGWSFNEARQGIFEAVQYVRKMNCGV